MQQFCSIDELKNVEDNKVVIGENVKLSNTVFRFGGKNNVLVIEDGVSLADCQIKLNGSSSVAYISKNKHVLRLNLDIYNNSAFFIGEDNYTNGVLNITISEQKNVFIGSDNLFAFGIWLRTADPHLVYSVDTKKRINPSKSVFIGDHVWIGQNVFVLKGSKIHSGSILGAGAVCAGKEIGSNTSWGGNPARKIADGIFWDKACVHAWTDKKIKENETFKSDSFIFSFKESEYVDFAELDRKLSEKKTADEKLAYLKEMTNGKKKNRFTYFPLENKKTKKGLFSKR